MRDVLKVKARYLEDRINQYARLMGISAGSDRQEHYHRRINDLEAELARTRREIRDLA